MAALRRRASLHDVKLKELAGGDGLMKETFGTKALGIMRSHHVAYDMILFSDFGYTQALTTENAHAQRPLRRCSPAAARLHAFTPPRLHASTPPRLHASTPA